MGKTKKDTNGGASKFDGFGVDFKCKLIGVADVSAARGDEMCQDAMAKLTAQALKDNKEKKAHKQKITVNITFKGIRLMDEASEKIEYAHPIHRISFISHDDNDKRTFGYVVGTREGYKLFAIKAMKEADHVTKTLKDLFQEVFERHQADKNKENAEPEETQATEETNGNATQEVGEELPKTSGGGEDPFLVDWGQLNEQIQVMQHDGMTHSDTTEMFSDIPFTSNQVDPFAGDAFTTQTTQQQQQQQDFNPFGDSTFQQQQQQSTTAPSDDLFSLNATTTPTVPTNTPAKSSNSTETDGPLLMNDPFAELKKNINEMHKQQQHQQQFAFQPGFNQGFPGQPSAYPQANPYIPAQQNNPFATPGFTSNQAPVMQPPVLPARPPQQQPQAAPNPFLNQQSQPTDDMGWTVTKPTPAPRQPQKIMMTSNGPDPFAFLDNQTGSKPQQQSQVIMTANNANQDPFDLLG